MGKSLNGKEQGCNNIKTTTLYKENVGKEWQRAVRWI